MSAVHQVTGQLPLRTHNAPSISLSGGDIVTTNPEVTLHLCLPPLGRFKPLRIISFSWENAPFPVSPRTPLKMVSINIPGFHDNDQAFFLAPLSVYLYLPVSHFLSLFSFLPPSFNSYLSLLLSASPSHNVPSLFFPLPLSTQWLGILIQVILPYSHRRTHSPLFFISLES